MNESPTPEAPSTAPTGHARGVVVYFDGVCGFCNHFVNFLLTRDTRGTLRFAPLQGETARARLAPADYENVESVVVEVNGRTFRKSAAVVQLLRELGGVWRIPAGVLWLIPAPLRDFGYRMFARMRYRLFGKHEACRLPTPEERARFLP
ncbi:thiol-disulfide oxidoreductase DCC family protein [Planctomicrobium sp. SH664]|uniref:thiol-disulfide oxidoreductase DCC family protein n=1 Tax=Planctomicrobium sp. SH664 TaxID=3448125 RepID=UPI003F5C0872